MSSKAYIRTGVSRLKQPEIMIPSNSFAFIDGSYNDKTGVYGCGIIFVDQFGRTFYLKKKGRKSQWASMRNVAGEILGAELALTMAETAVLDHLIIFYDYEGIAKWPMKEWEAKNAITQGYCMKVWKAMENGLSIVFKHIPAHSGIIGNEEADKLAKEAVGL